MSKIFSIIGKSSTCRIFSPCLVSNGEAGTRFFSAFKGNFSKCHTFTLTHTVMDCYLSSFHSAREKVNLTMMTFFCGGATYVYVNPVNTLIFSQ